MNKEESAENGVNEADVAATPQPEITNDAGQTTEAAESVDEVQPTTSPADQTQATSPVDQAQAQAAQPENPVAPETPQGDYYWQQGAQQPQQPEQPQQPYDQQSYDQQQSYGQQQSYNQQYSQPNAYNVPPQQQNYYQQPYSQPVVASKDHVAAGLLAIFLGSLGIHKFYLGYNTSGFIMLAVTILGSIITFGLAAAVMQVIALVEGILYLTKSQQEFEQIYVYNKREWF